ncbi:MAG: hypothetical protein IJ601_04120 [Acidaminococcaceae bacterium]|nr:hypothetical protein [Acidaminococcaceae bacterium]
MFSSFPLYKNAEFRKKIYYEYGKAKIIISRDALAPLYNEGEVLVMNIFDFLLNENSLEM